MVSQYRNLDTIVDDRVIGRKVLAPKERLLAKLYGCREEPEHCPEYREGKQGRQATAHRADSCSLVEVHRRLLLLEHFLLVVGVRIFCVDLVNLRLECAHLGR